MTPRKRAKKNPAQGRVAPAIPRKPLEPRVEPAMAVEGHPGGAPARLAFWHLPENLLLTFFFAVMMVLPLLDILARKLHGLFDWFPAVLVSGSLNLVQHAVLAIMMFGGAIAAREGKLLQLATTANMIPERFKAAAHILTAGIGAAITLYLVKAGFSFAMIERDVDSIIALGIPKWIVLMFLPIGFSLILVRMIWRSSEKWNERIMTLLVAGWLAYLAPMIHNPSETFIYVCFGLLMVAVVFGMPVFLVLGGAALIFLWNSDTPIDSIPAETYRMVVSPTIPTIPLFTLTGYFLAEGGASQRLLRVFQAFFGSLRGGPAIVTACVCAFFTAFTGGSGVTILALGGLLMPILLAEKYKERDALGLLTSAGSLGMLFPPSLPVILYGVVSGTSIKDLFLGGFMPGMILLLLTALWGILKAPQQGASHYSIWRTLKLWSGIGTPPVIFFPRRLFRLEALLAFGLGDFGGPRRHPTRNRDGGAHHFRPSDGDRQRLGFGQRPLSSRAKTPLGPPLRQNGGPKRNHRGPHLGLGSQVGIRAALGGLFLSFSSSR